MTPVQFNQIDLLINDLTILSNQSVKNVRIELVYKSCSRTFISYIEDKSAYDEVIQFAEGFTDVIQQGIFKLILPKIEDELLNWILEIEK